jgi:hypothetical protein
MPDSVLLHRPAPAPASLEHIFLDWTDAALPAVARLLTDRYAAGDELRMTDAVVVLPGSRAGRRLKELLVVEAEQRKLRLIPPRITRIGELPELLYPLSHPLASDALSRHVWARVLRDLPRERLGLLFASLPEDADPRGWSRLARVVAGLHREVSGAGKYFAEVTDACADGLLFADTERWSVLAELQAAYAAKIGELHLADRHLARLRAVAAGEIALDHDLWLVGVVELPEIVRRMIRSLPAGAGWVRVLTHAPEAEAAAFDALGCVRPDAWAERAIPLENDQIAICAHPADQAAEVVRALAACDGRYAAEEIVIAVPDAELIPYLEQRLGEAGVGVHAAAGTPLDRSRVVRLLAGIADLLDGGQYDAWAALARHPDLWRWLARTHAFAGEDLWLEPLDSFFNECLPARLAGPLANPHAHGAAQVDALRAALDDRLLGRLHGINPLSAWMEPILELVAELYGDPLPDRSVPADRRIIDACQALRDAANDLYRLPPALDEACDAPTAIRQLLDEVQGVALPADSERGAIELLGWLELHLDDAPVAVVTGFNEPFLPESVNAHAFLPNALRERLGMMDNAHRYARDAYELTALLRSRERVRVIAGRRGATGDPLRPSRLLFAVEGPELAARVQRFFHDAPARVAPATAVRPPAAPPGRFRMPAEPVIRAPEPLRVLPVTAFRHLLADPYLYALEKIVRLRRQDDEARELDGLRFGILAHEVLEHFARTAEVDSTDERGIRRRLDALLDERAHAHFGKQALPAVLVQLEQLRARLHGFARWQAGWIAQGWRVVGVECGTPRDGIPFAVDGEPFHLTGRIDRVDWHPVDGKLALFDYKTGDRGDTPEETHRSGRKESRRWIDLQLPLYRHLVSALQDGDGHHLFPEVPAEAIQLGYILLPGDPGRAGAVLASWSAEELADADACACEVVRGVRRNEFTFDRTHASTYRKSDLAPVLGIGSLESAAGSDGDEADAEGEG